MGGKAFITTLDFNFQNQARSVSQCRMDYLGTLTHGGRTGWPSRLECIIFGYVSKLSSHPSSTALLFANFVAMDILRMWGDEGRDHYSPQSH